MSDPLVKFGFTAGVLSPRLLFRSDLENYDLGLKKCRNFFVDYLGGVSTRPGTEFLDYIQDDDKDVRIETFEMNSNIANTYGMLFTHNRLRFLQDGAYVLESAVTVTGTTSTTVTAPSHGYVDGDWIKLNGRTLEVTAATADTFEVLTPFGAAADPSEGSPTSVQRIYTITTPYASTDLAGLTFDQDLNKIYITSLDFTPYVLTWTAHTNWSLAPVEFVPTSLLCPVNMAVAVYDGSGTNSGVVYAVTAVDAEGKEHPLCGSGIYVKDAVGNITAAAGSALIAWDIVPGAVYYRVYRTLYSHNDITTHAGMQFGFIGTTRANSFSDENIIPDFTDGPRIITNPFADGAITEIEITNRGSGYNLNGTTISISDPTGSGFEGFVIVRNNFIEGVRIINPGSNYSNPTVSFSGSGSGATANAIASTIGGNNPKCSTAVQQRRVYAGSTNFPLTLFGSRTGEPNSFFTTEFAFPNDPFILTINAKQASPIRFLVENSEGVFVFAEDAIYNVRGANDEAITVSNARAIPQPSQGCADVPPLVIDRQLVHLNRAGDSVNSLRPSNLPTYFVLGSISEFSEHYFSGSAKIKSWDWSKAPHRLIWAVRDDGLLLSCAFDSNQRPPVQAWSEHTTKGKFYDLTSILENNLDRVYVIVERTIGGTTKKFVERFAVRNVETPDEMFAVDSGLTTTLTKPAAFITPSAYTGTGVSVVASASVFSSGDVGKVLRVGGGRATVASFVSSTSITVDFDRDIVQKVPELTTPQAFPAGEWTLDAKVSSVSGLDHLEGETVEILGDGKELTAQVVSGGSVTLSTPSSYVVAGLGFSSHLQTLPPAVSDAVILNKEKRPVGVAVRLYQSKEILVGQDNLFYDLRHQGLTAYVTPTSFLEGFVETSLTAAFDLDGSVEFKKTGPIQATILGLVMEFEIARS